MEIILIGAQGSGKGTQASMLAQALGIPLVGSGDLFRKEMESDTEIGRLARQFIDHGNLVPDEVTIAMVLKRLQQPDCQTGALLDGFPRNIAQAEALDLGLLTQHKAVTAVLSLSVPREVLMQRLAGRYICRAQQHVYNIYTRPPKQPGLCDLDGSELYQRSDDVGEAVTRRLDIFFNQTIRLLDYYQRQGKVVEVDGNQPVEQVHRDLVKAVQEKSKA